MNSKFSNQNLTKIFLLSLLSASLVACSGQTNTDAPAEEILLEAKEPATVLEKTPDAETYQIDLNESMIQWHAYSVIPGNKEHHGTMENFSGEVFVKNGDLTGGNLTIDMTTIYENQDNDQLIDHLESPDFFDVSNFANSKINITSINKLESPDAEGNTHLISANLRIIGNEKNIEFPMIIRQREDGAFFASANISINRTDWGVVYGAHDGSANIADSAIKDGIDFNVRLVAKMQ